MRQVLRLTAGLEAGGLLDGDHIGEGWLPLLAPGGQPEYLELTREQARRGGSAARWTGEPLEISRSSAPKGLPHR